MSLISIILPTYNSRAIIAPTLDSILAQTVTDFELLIVDDGSTDSTVDFVRTNYTDVRIKVYAFPNAGVGGPSESRNRGLALASSPYIAFMNHDDLWSTDKLEKQLAALEANPHAGAAYSWIDHIDVEGNFLYNGSQTRTCGDAFAALLQGNFVETGSNPLIRRWVFDVVGGLDADYTLAADWNMWLRIARHFAFVCVPEVQVYFRDMPNALSANTPKMEMAGLKVLDNAFSNAGHVTHVSKSQTLSDFYEYLASRTLRDQASVEHGKRAIAFLKKALKHDARLLARKPQRIVRLCIKIAANLWLQPDQVEQALTVYQNRLA